MKNLIRILLFLISSNSFGQVDEITAEWKRQLYENLNRKNYLDSLKKYDFSILWTTTSNEYVYGFIGKNFQRLRLKIISVEKDINKPANYNVNGKFMFRNKVSAFNGTITIDSIRIYKKMHYGVDQMYKDSAIKSQGILIAKYHFTADTMQVDPGTFHGKLISLWFIDKIGFLRYDSIENYSDYYINNLFIGTWTNSLNKTLVCNWGDYRAPNSGDLDMGAGEFSPSQKYHKYGWKTYSEATWSEKPNKKAINEERRHWWKE